MYVSHPLKETFQPLKIDHIELLAIKKFDQLTRFLIQPRYFANRTVDTMGIYRPAMHALSFHRSLKSMLNQIGMWRVTRDNQ